MKRGGLIALIVFLVLLLIGLALTIVYAFFRPVIKPEARYRLVTYPPGSIFELQQNTRFEIFCDYADHNPTEVTQIEWSSRDYPIERNPYVQNFRNLSSKLIFADGTSQMNGRYTCKGSQKGYGKQRDITIKFRDFAPEFDRAYEYVEAYEGSNVIFNCRAQSNDKLSYRWFDNDLNPISSSDNVYIVDSYEASSLHIDNVQTNHDGYFTCNATNVYGTSSKSFILTVIHGGGPPKFVEKYTQITAKLNSRVEVHATAEGERPMEYIWYNQDEEIISSDESLPVYYVLSENGEATVLVFTNFQQTETGSYTCAAKNSYGLATKVFQFIADTGKAPVFLTDHQNVTFERGSKVELLCCDSNQAKNVTYQWINQHGEEVSENTTFPVYETITEKGSVLTIKSVKNNNDSEVYSCYAWNDYGMAFTEFEIQMDPISESAPSFKETYEVVLAKEGTKLEVLCTASADTPIEYSWYNQDSDLIGKDDNLAIYVTDSAEGSKLTIKEVKKSDSGTYTCNAKNNEGLHSKVFNIEVYAPPDEDGDETSIHFAKVVNATVDSILFAIATHESVESIEIAYNETWRGTLKTKTFKKGDPYEIKDLIPAAVYNINFRVSAPKTGNWSDVYRVPLLPRKPELIFRTLRDDMLVVDLATTIDERMRGAIDKYELTYRTVQIKSGSIWEPNECAVTFVKPACTGSRFTIAALGRQVYYELSVRGHTEAGFGEPYTQKFYLK